MSQPTTFILDFLNRTPNRAAPVRAILTGYVRRYPPGSGFWEALNALIAEGTVILRTSTIVALA